MRTNTLRPVLLAATWGLASLTAQATTDYSLRTFQFEAGFAPGLPPAPNSPVQFRDDFNNGNPLTGALSSVDGGVTAGPAGYSVLNNGFSAGRETLPADWAGATYGLGRLTLSAADARDTGANSLTVPGLTRMQNRLTVADGAMGSLLKSNTSFEVRSVWDFAVPDANSFYGLRLSDNAGDGSAYDDILDLRVVLGTDGRTKLNLRRATFDGVTTTNDALATFDLENRLASVGKGLADAAFVYFEFHYNYFSPGSSGNGVLGAFNVLDGTGNQLLNIHINNPDGSPRIFSLFNGEDFTRASVGALWQLAPATTPPVPEPGTHALLLAGLALIGAAARRRKA